MSITQAVPSVGGRAYTDHSGTVAAANQSQSCMTANPSRSYLFIQNNGSVDLWANVEGGAATAGGPSIRIPAGAWYEPPVPPTAAVALLSSALGLPFVVKEA